MSEIVFVRHGQASFGSESYDKLSERGIEQAKILGRHWSDTGERFDHLVSGSLLRQQETLAELAHLASDAEIDIEQNAAFNEYSGDPLIQIYLRDHMRDGEFDSHVQWPIKDPRLFQKVFERATAKWIEDALQPASTDAGFERFDDFRSRVHQAVDDLMSRFGSGSRILVSTSGGVIAMALQRVLNFPDEHVISTNWMVHNSSVTRIRYGGGRVSLMQFNSLPHLEGRDLQHMITYR